MRKYLKLRLASPCPETFTAYEYESDIYLSWAHMRELPNVTWQSDSLGTEQITQLLASRGWHQTDIGDELDEARTANQEV